MALQDQVISVPFTQGVDSKIDPKALPASKLISLVDGVFPKGNQITKRNGYTNLLSFQSVLTRSFNNQLLLGDGNNLYAYSADSQTKQNVGTYTSVSVTPTIIPVSHSGAREIRTASYTSATGNYSCTVYITTLVGTSVEAMFVNITDITTGVTILNDSPIPCNGGIGSDFAQVFVINASTTPIFGILYTGITLDLTYASVTISGGVATVSSGHTLDGSSPVLSFNAINSGGTTSYVSYSQVSSATITTKIATLVGNTLTAIVSATTMPSGSVFCQTQSSLDVSGNIWTMTAYEDTGATTANIYYCIVNTSLTFILNSTLITTYTAVDQYDPSSVALSPQSNGTMRAYYSRKTLIGTEGTAGAAYFLTTYWSPITSAGGSGFVQNVYLQNMELQSNFVTFNSSNYVVVGNVLPSLAATLGGGAITVTTVLSDQNAYFLIDEATGTAVAKCLTGSALPISLDQYLTFSVSGNARPNLNPLTVTGSILYFGGATLLENSNQVLENGSGSSLIPLVQTAARLEQFNFSNPQAYQSVVFQNTAVFNGGVLKGYDGQSLTELDFLTYPDALLLTPGTGGQMGAGQYSYAVTYAWVDANNQSYESFPQQQNVTVAATGSVSMIIQTLGLTEKGLLAGQQVYINIYRTDADQQILFFLDRLLIPHNSTFPFNVVSPTITFTDFYGPSLLGQPELYNTGGVLENDPPPPSMILTVRENRLYAVDSENPNTDYWFTKTPNKGFGISFSAFLVESIDSVGGAITSQAQMDEKLVTFKETSLGYQVGDGPNDTGANSTLSNFQFIPTDSGSRNHRATITIPSGCIYQSDKGIYLLDRGLQINYKGSPVQQFNSQFITQSTMMQSVNAVRFLCSSGLTLVYNYFFDQWSTFSNHIGNSADVFGGFYTYSRYDGKVFQENTTTFLDDTLPYSLNIQISWLKMAGIQGFQRIKQMLVLGDHKSPVSGHGLTVAAAYNYNQNSFGVAAPFLFMANSTTTNFQYRDFFSQQKCDSLSLILTEVITGTSGEFIDLTDLTFLAGVKKGLHKLSAADSVG